tara:strand:+ start:1500 stop:2006 length:507 start_codon:yes stop_codon:yes gene_type:complete
MGEEITLALKFVRTDLDNYGEAKRAHLAKSGYECKSYEDYKRAVEYQSVAIMDSVDTLITEPEDAPLPLPLGLLSLLQNQMEAEIRLDGPYITAYVGDLDWSHGTGIRNSLVQVLSYLEDQDMDDFYGFCSFCLETDEERSAGSIDDCPFVGRYIELDTSEDAKVVRY